MARQVLIPSYRGTGDKGPQLATWKVGPCRMAQATSASLALSVGAAGGKRSAGLKEHVPLPPGTC